MTQSRAFLRRRTGFITVFAVLGLPAVAHHSSAQYDASLRVTITGVVTGLAWANPHSHLYVEAKDEHNALATWQFDLPSVNRLVRLGWSRHALNPGDAVTVTAARSRTLPTVGWAVDVIDSRGKKLFVDTAAGAGQ